jgi:Family of unknown function (DUF5996)
MANPARVFARVPVRRGVATERDAAALAGAEVYPLRTDLDALFARPTVLRVFDAGDRGDMGTGVWHAASVSWPMTDILWPALPYDAWRDTYATLHLWMQVVGKIALAQAPPLNHSWGIALQVTPRGLSTRTLPHGRRSFTIEFDFIDHQLLIRVSDGATRTMALRPQTVAGFYRDVMGAMRELSLPVRIWPVSVEMPSAIRLDEDTAHSSYDPEYANRLFRILVQVERVLGEARCEFVGKCSPVHFFWGGFDLAVTRFSGRPAPPREGPAFMREAYSHEVISHGFWPGSPPTGPGQAPMEAVFYAYAVPEPAGLKEAAVQPSGAFYHRDLGEFILPYEAVRTAANPDEALRAFVDSTYEQAATLAGWNRSALEHRLDPSTVWGSPIDTPG